MTGVGGSGAGPGGTGVAGETGTAAGGTGGSGDAPPPCAAGHGPAWLIDGTAPGEPAAGGPGALSPGAGPDGLLQVGRALGAARWVEHTLFEVVGSWAADDACAEATALWAVLARQFAWHADLLADRLPVLAVADPDRLTVPPPGWRDLGAALAAGGTLARLVGLGRAALPRLVVAYARWLAMAGRSEAPVRRVVRLILADERDAWLAVEAMAQDHGGDRGGAEVAGRHLAAVEARILGSPLGPGNR